MQVLHKKVNQVIPIPEAISFKNELGAVEQGKLTFYPLQKSFLINTIATVDQTRYKDTRYNVALFLVSFFFLLLSFIEILVDFSLLFRFFAVVSFFGTMFFKKERFVLTLIFVHRKAISFSVTKQQFYLSWPLLNAVGRYQMAHSRFNKDN